MAGQMQDEILAKAQLQIKAGKKDFELLGYGAYIGNMLGSKTGYMLGSSAPPGEPTQIRGRREQGRTMRDGDVIYYQCENTGPGGMMTHVGRYYVLGKAPQELVDAFGIICEAQDHTVRMLQPRRVGSPKEIFAEHNLFMEKHGMHKEPRLHCHGQGYDVVERPMIRHDEDMPLDAGMKASGCTRPSATRNELFVTVCDNFLIGLDGKIEHLHKTPRKIFELRHGAWPNMT